MSTSKIKRTVKAGSSREASKAARIEAQKDGYTVLGAANPTETSSGNWEVEVMIEGEEKKTLKSVLTPKKKPSKKKED